MYERRRLRVGEEFEAPLNEALDMIACGIASVVEPVVVETTYGAESLELISVRELPALLLPPKKRGPDKKPRKKRTYNRRDMEAE